MRLHLLTGSPAATTSTAAVVAAAAAAAAAAATATTSSSILTNGYPSTASEQQQQDDYTITPSAHFADNGPFVALAVGSNGNKPTSDISSVIQADPVVDGAIDVDDVVTRSASSFTTTTTRLATNSLVQEPPLSELPANTTMPTALILGTIILITFVGNILVCLSVIKVRKLRHPSNYLLISLAISDLCVACVVMPFGLYQSINDKWQLGRLLCNVYVVSDVTSCTASILNLCVISIDRYLAITRPLTYCVKRTTRLMMILIAIVWICACLISGKLVYSTHSFVYYISPSVSPRV